MRQQRFLPRHTGLRVSKTWHAQSSSFLILGWDWPWQSPYKGSVKHFSPPCTTPKSSLTTTKGVLVWSCPPPLSLVYWHLRPPHPLGPSRDFPWDGCECILEKNVPVPTVCCFSFLNHFFIILQAIHCTASVIHLDIAEVPFCQLLLIHDYHLHGSFTTLLVELEQELSFQPLSEILYVPWYCQYNISDFFYRICII